MTHDLRWKFLFILILAIVCAYIAYPFEKPLFGKGEVFENVKINLGIDLQGGAELRYKVLAEEGEDVAKLTRQAINVISKRIDIRGIKEPKITSYGSDQIIVQLAGVDADTVKEYKKLFKTIGALELCVVADRDIHERYPPDPKAASRPVGYRLVRNVERGGREWINKYDYLWVEDEPTVTGQEITNASTGWEYRDGWGVNFTLNAAGTKRFGEVTRKLAQKGYIAIILDKELISRPFVNTPITDGSGRISGGFATRESAEELAIVLRSGSLPAPIGRMVDGEKCPGEPEAESFVGPTLGQDSIKRGAFAALVALLCVALFMLIYYRLAGFVAVSSLLLNLIFVIALMSVLGATLTLPGIAGIVLTIGMAVDANILILERIREEKGKGKTPYQAFEAGHARALTTILDANITTFIAGVVLYYFGTGPIRGFAVTLTLGILCTLFTALFCTKVFLRMLMASGMLKEFRMARLFKTPNIGFISIARTMVGLSVLMLIGSIAFFAIRGKENYGIDFKGGSTLTLCFNKKEDIGFVRGKIREILVEDEKGRKIPKYPDAEIQTVATQEEGLKQVGQTITRSRLFQIRLSSTDIAGIKKDLQKVFADRLSKEPFEDIPEEELTKNPRDPFYEGAGTYIYLRNNPPLDFEMIKGKIVKLAEGLVERDEVTGEPKIGIERAQKAPSGLVKAKLLITREDKKADKLRILKEKIKDAKDIPLSSDPFLQVGSIGPAVAEELTRSAIWALLWSWALMIIYIGFRFHSMVFGLSTVIALIHDALIAIGVVALCGLLIPDRWGLNFVFTLQSVAAILMITGYSVNDTIVVLDRIRENLALMRRETFSRIINTSINHVLSRTVLTSFTTWMVVVILYIFTIRSSTGIENLAFPLIVGIIVGTYSSIYIASPVLLFWYRKTKPQIAT